MATTIVSRISMVMVGRRLLCHGLGEKRSIIYVEIEANDSILVSKSMPAKILRIDTIGDNKLKIVKEGTLAECDLYYRNLLLTESKLN